MNTVSTRNRECKENEENLNTPFLLPYGSYLIDAVIFRIKSKKAKKWAEVFLEKNQANIPIKVFVRVNPYKTLELLWVEHLRVALRGQTVKKFLEITNLVEEIPEEDIDNIYVNKGVRVIPIAPAWIPKNRILLELLMEYLLGRITEELIKKIFYSAFIKMFKREEILSIEHLADWRKSNISAREK